MHTIYYSFSRSQFGAYLIASDDTGICSFEFIDAHDTIRMKLQKKYPKSTLIEEEILLHKEVKDYFDRGIKERNFPLSLSGTEFQRSVWRALTKIPRGETSTYREIAIAIGNPRAVRAVGTAIGANPVSYLIPCHRVIRTDGGIGGYMWGVEKKVQILKFEGVTVKGEL